MEKHTWLGPVDKQYLALAKQVRDTALAQAEAQWAQAVSLVAKELGVPDGVQVDLMPVGDMVQLRWTEATERHMD